MARALARRYGLRLYSADTRTWEHRDRALQAGVAAAARWESLAPEERFNHDSDSLLEMSLHAVRSDMIAQDLASLPSAPLVVAEGTPISAQTVESGGARLHRAIWLMPTVDFFEHQLAARATPPGAARLYRRLRDGIEQDAREHALPTIAVTLDTDASAIIAAVEEQFRPLLTTGPSADTRAERRALLREMNEAVARQVLAYLARPHLPAGLHAAPQRFVCECGATTCEAELLLSVEAVAAGRTVLAPGHG